MKTPAGPVLALAAGALAYVIAAAAGKQILHTITPQLSMTLARPVTASLVFLIQLLPGFVAGAMHRQRVLLLGFGAGVLGALVQGIVGVVMSISTAGADAPDFPFGAAALDIILSAIPVGILAAAGGAVALIAVGGHTFKASKT
jgi:hypothetical protein